MTSEWTAFGESRFLPGGETCSSSELLGDRTEYTGVSPAMLGCFLRSVTGGGIWMGLGETACAPSTDYRLWNAPARAEQWRSL